jgi:hypothetical protein
MVKHRLCLHQQVHYAFAELAFYFDRLFHNHLFFIVTHEIFHAEPITAKSVPKNKNHHKILKNNCLNTLGKAGAVYSNTGGKVNTFGVAAGTLGGAMRNSGAATGTAGAGTRTFGAAACTIGATVSTLGAMASTFAHASAPDVLN